MRKPIYCEDQKHRVVSFPNGQWACQAYKPEPNRRGTFAGQNYRPKSSSLDQGQPHIDPWVNTQRPTTKDEALRQLALFGKIAV